MSSTPLNDPEWDNFDRALLASAELDRPEPGALARATRALGAATLGSAVLVSTSASLGASSGAMAVGVSLAALSKALLVGALVGVGFVGVVNGGYSSPRETAHTPSPVQRPTRLAAAPRETASRSANRGAASPEAQPALQSAALSRGIAVRERPLPAAKVPVTSLSVEVALLDRARAALVRKDPRAALSELDRYAQLSFGRSLEREASLLRIEALRDLGRAASAADLVQRLVDEDPQGLTGQRARELMR